MKIQKSIFTLLVLLATTIFVGCNTTEYDVVTPEAKLVYTASEKAEIYALAEKYELEILPMEQTSNQPLQSINELEEKFKIIYKKNNTKIPLVRGMDGVYRIANFSSSNRIKTRSEGKEFYGIDIARNEYYSISSCIAVGLDKGVSDLPSTLQVGFFAWNVSTLSHPDVGSNHEDNTYATWDLSDLTASELSKTHTKDGFSFSFTINHGASISLKDQEGGSHMGSESGTSSARGNIHSTLDVGDISVNTSFFRLRGM